MVEIKRTIRCSNCQTDSNFYLSSEMELNELLIHGNCSRCGNSLQLNFNIVEKGGEDKESSSESDSTEATNVNLDETLFNEPADLPSEAIKDLMGS